MSTVLAGGPVTAEARKEVVELSENDSVSLSDITKDKVLQNIYRDLGKRSLYIWTKGILKYPDLTPRTHIPLCNFIQDLSNLRTLTLLPRGTYKTTIGTIGFASWYLVNVNPDHYIMIGNQTELNLERMVQEIEGHFDGSNPWMNALYPQHIKPNAKWKYWSSRMMTLPGRNIPRSGTPSITGMPVGAKAESWHFHVRILDDLIGEKAMKSQREMLAAITWHDYCESLFVSPRHGISRDYGTRWDLADLYSVVMNKARYKVYMRPAVDPVTGELFFPELLDQETLDELRLNNYAHYMSQYMNDPENPEALDFNRTWLLKYRLIDTPKGPACQFASSSTLYYVSDMDVVVAVDPAASGDTDAIQMRQIKGGRTQKSNNAIVLWGYHPTGYYFLLDMWYGRGRGENPELQIAKHMYDMSLAWRGYVRRIFVESYGAQRALITIFDMLCMHNGHKFPCEEIARGNKTAKDVRIRTALGGPGQNGQIAIRHSQARFEYEFGRFNQDPNAKDVLDASTWAFTQLRRKAPPAATERKDKEKRRRKSRMRMSIGRTGY